jgi:hypothetical protein
LLIILSGVLAVLQAPGFHCFQFDSFPLIQNSLPPSEVDVCGRKVVDAFVVSVMIVMIDECFDLYLKVCWKEVVFQQDAVLQRLMPPLNLTLSLWMVWRAPDVPHFFITQPFSEFTRDVAGPVV